MASETAERRISCVAIMAYGVVVFLAAWVTAHAYALDPNPGDPDALGTAAGVFVVFLLPLLTGLAIGRWWAPLVVFLLVVGAGIADTLEPVQHELSSGEFEPGLAFATLMVGCVHIPLLLAGVAIRKVTRPRPPAKRWSLT